MTELEGCIQFWKAKLAHDSYLMEPSVIVGIQNTVRYLEELQRLKNLAVSQASPLEATD